MLVRSCRRRVFRVRRLFRADHPRRPTKPSGSIAPSRVVVVVVAASVVVGTGSPRRRRRIGLVGRLPSVVGRKKVGR